MPTNPTKPGWLPVVGGPCDEHQLYGVDHLPAGTRIVVLKHGQSSGWFLPEDEMQRGHYSLGLNRDRIEWVRG